MRNMQTQILSHIIDIGALYHRQGPAYIDERIAELVFARGKVMLACTDAFDAGYPYTKGYHKCYVGVATDTEYALIRISRYDDTVSPPERHTIHMLYIRGYGWWKFENGDAMPVKTVAPPTNLEWIEMESGIIYAGNH